jgi:hypothetical protein
MYHRIIPDFSSWPVAFLTQKNDMNTHLGGWLKQKAVHFVCKDMMRRKSDISQISKLWEVHKRRYRYTCDAVIWNLESISYQDSESLIVSLCLLLHPIPAKQLVGNLYKTLGPPIVYLDNTFPIT